MTVLLTQTHGGVHNRTRGSARDRHLYIHVFITTCRNAKDSFTHMQTHEGIYNRIRENPNAIVRTYTQRFSLKYEIVMTVVLTFTQRYPKK